MGGGMYVTGSTYDEGLSLILPFSLFPTSQASGMESQASRDLPVRRSPPAVGRRSGSLRATATRQRMEAPVAHLGPMGHRRKDENDSVGPDAKDVREWCLRCAGEWGGE